MKNVTKIPNDLSIQFKTREGRKVLIDTYGDSNSMFFGENEDGENVYLSIAHTGIVLKTEQDNGWVRVNYYDENGYSVGEGFDGKWR